MGTWHTGPFDNDSAADFAGDVRDCTGPAARGGLLTAALRGGQEYLRTNRALTEEYSWGYELEHAIAAAAFVADEYTGEKRFTDCSYARGVGDDMELLPYVEFLPPSAILLIEARWFVKDMLTAMRFSGISEEWVEPVEEIGNVLNKKKVRDD